MASVTSALAVVAHPDDESFGLGGLLSLLTDRSVPVSVLCFTHGEASTLRDRPGDLAVLRATELRQAATALGVGGVELLDYPDGALATIDLDHLVGHVVARIIRWRPSHLVVFDLDGVTGHTDHIRATEATLAAARHTELPVLAWTVPQRVAARLNTEFATGFVGRAEGDIDETVSVSRARQWRAIARHRSQSADNPVLRRRLELLGDTEHLSLLHDPAGFSIPSPQRRHSGCTTGGHDPG
ncbi:MAG: PIG-L family deacetylase [Dactylosporangium sp.]|nr:PIG-L family deacetylase [Dactylosporangium sp.]